VTGDAHVGAAAEHRASHTRSVARYYESNTRRFLLAGSRGAHAMHRELWAPGVRSAAEAVTHVDRLVGDELADLLAIETSGGAPLVLDFGCGVGGTLLRLAERFPHPRLRGVTLSVRQVEIAERLTGEHGFAERCSFECADFQAMQAGELASAIVAVESFAHSASADAFLSAAVRHLRPHGRLVIVDDFLAGDEGELTPRQRLHVGRLRAGWRVPAVCTVEHLTRRAERHGLRLQKVDDLSPHTRPGRRLRDRLIALVGPLLAGLGLARSPLWGNMIGGNALQIGLREGFLRYRLVTLERVP